MIYLAFVSPVTGLRLDFWQGCIYPKCKGNKKARDDCNGARDDSRSAFSQ